MYEKKIINGKRVITIKPKFPGMMDKQTKIDPYAGEEFIPKRKNQIYATRKNQVDHNNYRARAQRIIKGKVSRMLNQNWKIMDNLLKALTEMELSIEFLKGKGFDFSAFTQISSQNDQPIYMVYNYYWRKINNTTVIIGKNESN